MKLTIHPREKAGKGALNRIRREGNIPAVIYSKGSESKNAIVDGVQLKSLMRTVKQGCLPTTVFVLSDGEKEVKAIVKDIHYAPTTYNILHLDFMELRPDVRVTVKVPIQCTGAMDCVGIKLGGFLRQVILYLPVECLPKDIPSEFSLDVRELQITQTKRLKDIEIPQGVRPVANMDEVAVVIAKR